MMRVAVALVPGIVLMSARLSAAPLFGQWGSAFPHGTRAVEVDATYIHPIRFSDDHFYGAGVRAHYYFGDEVSLGVGLEGYYVDQVRDDTVLGAANVHFRWHFLAHERYSLFFDAGVGLSYAAADVPETGTRFNYTPRLGLGGTFELREDVHLLGGVRFFHLSNGNLYGRDENPSQDGAQFYAGVLFTF